MGTGADPQPRITVKLKLQIFVGADIAIGPGKAALLEAVATHRSISGAGRALGMSYRRAWLLIDVMNRCWRAPLVVTSVGGKAGGGAMLSPLGAEILSLYRTVQSDIERGADGEALQRLQSLLVTEA